MVAAVSRNGRKAVERLVEDEGDRIYGLALKLCRQPAEAEDLVQETFLQALRKWDQFEGRSEPTSWLYTIAARLCLRRNRRRAGEPQHLESLADLLPAVDAQIPAPTSDPLEDHLQRETRERVEQALADLPIHLRLPLVLKEIAELSLAQIAAILGLKEATVKTRVHRGRLALRKALVEVLPSQPAAPPDHARRVCLDLLSAKQEALDRGVEFPVPPQELCTRCQSLFSTLDLAMDACQQLGGDGIPASLRRSLLDQARTV